MKKLLVLIPVLLCGCTGLASIGQQGAGSVLGGLGNGGSLTPITNLNTTYLLQLEADLHNLEIGLAQIKAAPGMVAITNPAPVIQPMPTPIVIPTPPTPPVVVVPTTPVPVPVPPPIPKPPPVPTPPPVSVPPPGPNGPAVLPRHISWFKTHRPLFCLDSSLNVHPIGKCLKEVQNDYHCCNG